MVEQGQPRSRDTPTSSSRQRRSSAWRQDRRPALSASATIAKATASAVVGLVDNRGSAGHLLGCVRHVVLASEGTRLIHEYHQGLSGGYEFGITGRARLGEFVGEHGVRFLRGGPVPLQSQLTVSPSGDPFLRQPAQLRIGSLHGIPYVIVKRPAAGCK